MFEMMYDDLCLTVFIAISVCTIERVFRAISHTTDTGFICRDLAS